VQGASRPIQKYGREYVFKNLDEALENMGIPEDKREHTVNVTEDAVIVSITYNDKSEFFGRYTKDFNFNYECKGGLRSVF
jgi:hypothetical protein